MDALKLNEHEHKVYEELFQLCDLGKTTKIPKLVVGELLATCGLQTDVLLKVLLIDYRYRRHMLVINIYRCHNVLWLVLSPLLDCWHVWSLSTWLLRTQPILHCSKTHCCGAVSPPTNIWQLWWASLMTRLHVMFGNSNLIKKWNEST